MRKCCDVDEIYAASSGYCAPSRGYATQYFDDLAANASLFLRVGNLDCAEMELTPAGVDFQLLASGHLRMDDGQRFRVDVHPDFYCLDDFVRFDGDDLPETINQVHTHTHTHTAIDVIRRCRLFF